MFTYESPHLLSRNGSTRGTAYRFGNRCITLGDKTHVVWTDCIAHTRGCTFDHVQNTWGPVIDIGHGVDNHNSPAMTADAEGILRIAWGPHGQWGFYLDDGQPNSWPTGTFKYAIAEKPNSLDCFKLTRSVGYKGSYASLLNTCQGFDCLVYRGGEHPPSLLFQCVNSQGAWSSALEIFRQDVPPGYTHNGAQVVSDGDGVLYVAGHFFSGGCSTGVAVVKTVDLGQTWYSLSGKRLELPMLYCPEIACPHPDAEQDPRLAGLATDSHNRLWIVSNGTRPSDRQVLLSVWIADRWETIDVAEFLPSDLTICRDIDLTIDTQDRIHLVVCAGDTASMIDDDANWYHPTQEVWHMVSTDGGSSFESRQVSTTDSEHASWVATMSKAGPHHPVELPVILYQHGPNGGSTDEGCRTTTPNEIYCVRILEG